MRTVSDHIALLQDDVDPGERYRRRGIVAGKWKKFQVLLSLEKRSPAITAGGAMQLIIVYL